MLSLCAVEPDGCRCIGDIVHVVELSSCAGIGGWYIAGPEAIGRRRAWACECGLRDGVVLGPELEPDDVADVGGDLRGFESQTVFAYNDIDVIGDSSASKGESRDGGGETHYDWC